MYFFYTCLSLVQNKQNKTNKFTVTVKHMHRKSAVPIGGGGGFFFETFGNIFTVPIFYNHVVRKVSLPL